jgi:hypothetical protein
MWDAKRWQIPWSQPLDSNIIASVRKQMCQDAFLVLQTMLQSSWLLCPETDQKSRTRALISFGII